MKKITLLTLIVLLFASCGDKITEITEVTQVTQVVDPYTFTDVYRIFAEDMIIREDITGVYFEYEFVEPALTKTVFDYGILQAFLYYKKDNRDTLCPLPFSDFVVKDGFQWEEQFTVEFQIGRIKFIQKVSDHSPDLPIAEFYDVLVRFLW